MLTCKIGESIINCIDCTYDRYQLKMWSNKGILKCPVCNRDYEYCHGEVVPPYFRHKDKECTGYYTEPETEEHKKGKTLLYEWLKNQPGIENLQLESWIPETKQRPDIYFEQNGQRYVIEYQCTPIASEYIKRRELYKLNNINDIWILGTEKYKVYLNNELYQHDYRYKTIEKSLSEENKLIYLNINSDSLLINKSFLKTEFTSTTLDNVTINRNILIQYLTEEQLDSNFISMICNSDLFISNSIQDFIISKELKFNNVQRDSIIKKISTLEQANNKYLQEEDKKQKHIEQIFNDISMDVIDSVEFTLSNKKSPYYQFLLTLPHGHVIFIKNNKIDFCDTYPSTYPVKRGNTILFWKNHTKYFNKDSVEIDNIYDEKVIDFIKEKLASLNALRNKTKGETK